MGKLVVVENGYILFTADRTFKQRNTEHVFRAKAHRIRSRILKLIKSSIIIYDWSATHYRGKFARSSLITLSYDNYQMIP